MKVLTCIPVFNESKEIFDLVKKAQKYSDLVLVCDDGSTDDTTQSAIKAGARVIRHKKNMGKGAALKTLFQESLNHDPQIIITIDGDGQFLPEEIPLLINSLEQHSADIVIGNRFSGTEMPKYRKFGNLVLDKITNLAADLPFNDTQSGFRAYSKNAIKSIKFNNDGFGADSEILIDASKKGLKIVEQNVTVLYNLDNDTSTKNPISHSTNVISSILEIIAIQRPLLLLGLPGILFTIIGMIYLITAVSLFNETRYFSIPTTLISLGLLIVGLILLLISVVLFAIGKLLRNK